MRSLRLRKIKQLVQGRKAATWQLEIAPIHMPPSILTILKKTTEMPLLCEVSPSFPSWMWASLLWIPWFQHLLAHTALYESPPQVFKGFSESLCMWFHLIFPAFPAPGLVTLHPALHAHMRPGQGDLLQAFASFPVPTRLCTGYALNNELRPHL